MTSHKWCGFLLLLALAVLLPAAALGQNATVPAAPGSTPPAVAAPASPPLGASAPATRGPVGLAALPHDLSPWTMFQTADNIVKAVMIGLAIASVVTWTVWLAKAIELFTLRRRLTAALAALGAARTLAEADGGPPGPSADFVRAALAELHNDPDASPEGIKERVASRLERIEAAAGRAMSHGTGVLATIGATAPFVGLFGTVWGIMNSFIGIAKTQTTNLAVVAPGIAEALLATALGLVAAIPAVVIYNLFARKTAGCRAGGRAAAAVLRLVSARTRSRRTRAKDCASRRSEPGWPCCSITATTTWLREPRDQRHAVYRRDAGAADHLYGRGAARDRRRRGRSAGLDRAAAAAPGQAALPDDQGRPHAGIG